MPQVPSTSQEASSGPPPGSSQNCTGPLLDQSLEEASQNSPGIKYHFFAYFVPGLDPLLQMTKACGWEEADDYLNIQIFLFPM